MRANLTKVAIAVVMVIGMAAPGYAHETKGIDGANRKTKLDIRSYSVTHQRTMSYATTQVTISGAITTGARFGNKVLKNGYLAMKFDAGSNDYQLRISRAATGFKASLFQLGTAGKALVGTVRTWRKSPKSMGFSFPKALIGKTNFRFSALSVWKGCGCRDTTAWVRHRA